MEMFDKLKLKYHTYRYNKLIEQIRKDEQIQRQAALDYLMEEIDRKLNRSKWLINLFHNIREWKGQSS